MVVMAQMMEALFILVAVVAVLVQLAVIHQPVLTLRVMVAVEQPHQFQVVL
jgi:hypothetical protein